MNRSATARKTYEVRATCQWLNCNRGAPSAGSTISIVLIRRLHAYISPWSVFILIPQKQFSCRGRLAAIGFLAAFCLVLALARPAAAQAPDPASLVNPLIGTTNGGNDYPGAVLPFGMVAWSPEQPSNKPRRKVEGVPGSMKDDRARPAAPGGYEYTATKIRGFSLTHLMGTGCAGASGDIPFMPISGSVQSSPSDDGNNEIYASLFSHADETAIAGDYRVKLANGVTVELTATPRIGAGRFTYPAGQPATMLVRTSDSEPGSTDASIRIDAVNAPSSGVRHERQLLRIPRDIRSPQLLHPLLCGSLRSRFSRDGYMAGFSCQPKHHSSQRWHHLWHTWLPAAGQRIRRMGHSGHIRVSRCECPRRHLLCQRAEC